MEHVDPVDVALDRGVWAVRSASASVYLLDARGERPQMMQLSSPASGSRAWWDNTRGGRVPV